MPPNPCSLMIVLTPWKTGVDILNQKSITFLNEERRRREELQRIEDEKARRKQEIEDAKYQKKLDRAEETGRPVAVAPVIVPRTVIASVAVSAGATVTTRYTAVLSDKKAFIAAVAAGTIPEFYITVPLVPFNTMATACKKEGPLEGFPGVTVAKVSGISQRV